MTQLLEALQALGYATPSEAYYRRIALWRSWYEGEVQSFHRYLVRTGTGTVPCRRYSLGMGKKVAEDWADLLMNEKVRISLAGAREQAFLNRVLEENQFFLRANALQELTFALGTAAIVPRLSGGRQPTICLDYVAAEQVIPLAWENGQITQCAFAGECQEGKTRYVYLQLHLLGADGQYQLHNRLFRQQDSSLQAVPLASLPAYAQLPEVVHTASSRRPFVILRPNLVNNLEPNCPMGISVFANALDVLQGVDIAYDSYVNEFQLGKKRIMVKPAATCSPEGEPYFDAGETLFYVLPEDVSEGNIITPIDMTLRSEAHHTGMQDLLNLLASKCGLGEHYYLFDRSGVTTATQVISEQSSLFRTLRKHSLGLEQGLRELCRILLELGQRALGEALDVETEITIDLDDSIIEDKSAEFTRDLQLLQAGVLTREEMRQRWA